MSNWIESGGEGPRLRGDAEIRPKQDRRRTARRRMSSGIGFAILLAAAASDTGNARDRGQFANSNAELKAWFDGLKSARGPCCSDADGTAISDADWESGGGRYRVRIEGEWVDVPEDAVISEPNRVGRTMVWPIRGYLGLTIRCFMPGSMT